MCTGIIRLRQGHYGCCIIQLVYDNEKREIRYAFHYKSTLECGQPNDILILAFIITTPATHSVSSLFGTCYFSTLSHHHLSGVIVNLRVSFQLLVPLVR